MAFSKEHRRIAELKNIERHHGFMDVDGATIQECAEFIMTPVENEETRQNAKNISKCYRLADQRVQCEKRNFRSK